MHVEIVIPGTPRNGTSGALLLVSSIIREYPLSYPEHPRVLCGLQFLIYPHPR